MLMDKIHLFFYKKMMTKIKQLEKENDYLRRVNEILWSYIPESDYELNEKISKEINEVEAK